MRRASLFLFLLLVGILLGGCGHRPSSPARGPHGSYGGAYSVEEDMAAPEQVALSRSRSSKSTYREAPAPSARPQDAAAPAGAESEPPPASETRKVHYEGWARIRVARVDRLLQRVAAIAEELGGRVKYLSGSTIRVAVPVDHFEDAFRRVQELGDVADRSISAADVTESITAIDLRLRTLKATRTRLQALLAEAEDEEERLRILAEIQRTTEQIDLLESQLRVLEDLAAFSTITVEGVGRQGVARRAPGHEPDGLGWISSLSAFRRDVAWSGNKLSLSVPEGFVDLKLQGRFVAEAADGSVIWTGRLPNQPRGDTDFWTAALRERLERGYDEVTEEQWGEYTVLRMLNAADEPYRYRVAVRARGRWLYLVEVYFPGEEEEQRHLEAVRAVVGDPPARSQRVDAGEGRQG